mmetsp:Transcript_47485/g.76958  ORF Transcript_47485/g.76958 Transcript_47485/m.76958 type:complete len:265 (-) Transcript_47485:546-1340(-)
MIVTTRARAAQAMLREDRLQDRRMTRKAVQRGDCGCARQAGKAIEVRTKRKAKGKQKERGDPGVTDRKEAAVRDRLAEAVRGAPVTEGIVGETSESQTGGETIDLVISITVQIAETEMVLVTGTVLSEGVTEVMLGRGMLGTETEDRPTGTESVEMTGIETGILAAPEQTETVNAPRTEGRRIRTSIVRTTVATRIGTGTSGTRIDTKTTGTGTETETGTETGTETARRRTARRRRGMARRRRSIGRTARTVARVRMNKRRHRR